MGFKDLMSRMLRDEEDDEFDEGVEKKDSMDFVSKNNDTEKVLDSNPKKGNKVVNIHATAQLQVV